MHITGTHIAYLHTCHRKLWLFANGIQMEHTSELVGEGKLIAETTYLDRSRKYTELAIEGIKIDFYDTKNKVIHVYTLSQWYRRTRSYIGIPETKAKRHGLLE